MLVKELRCLLLVCGLFPLHLHLMSGREGGVSWWPHFLGLGRVVVEPLRSIMILIASGLSQGGSYSGSNAAKGVGASYCLSAWRRLGGWSQPWGCLGGRPQTWGSNTAHGSVWTSCRTMTRGYWYFRYLSKVAWSRRLHSLLLLSRLVRILRTSSGTIRRLNVFGHIRRSLFHSRSLLRIYSCLRIM